MSLRNRVLARILKKLLCGDLPPVRIAFWDGDVVDSAPHPTVKITIHKPELMRMFATGNLTRLGDAYVTGDLTAEGPIEDILQIGISLAEQIGKWKPVKLLNIVSSHLPYRHSRHRDAAAIRHHYDVSNEFYRLWLDRNMVYSCAYFRTGTEDIDTAQEQKLNHICRKLRLAPGERLLDIGCGWGGLLVFAARHFGISGVGVTISERQYEYARQWIADQDLSDRIEIRLQDYRDVAGADCFDKIVSIGMYEHVGLRNLPAYFGAIARLLRPGGVVLNHGIIATDPKGRAQGPPGGEFIGRHVFPGGEVPHLARVVTELARHKLEVTDVEDLRPHYALTLLRWVRRLEAEAQQAQVIAGAERYRVWRMYMAGMAHAFDRGWLSIAQVLAYKPRHSGMAHRPWTRAYQYARDEDPPLADGLNWSNCPGPAQSGPSGSPPVGREDPSAR